MSIKQTIFGNELLYRIEINADQFGDLAMHECCDFSKTHPFFLQRVFFPISLDRSFYQYIL